MAVRTSNFEIAALDAETPAKDAEENLAELKHGSGVFSLWRRPSPGQYAMFQLRLSRDSGDQRMKGLDRFFSALVLTPREAVANDRVDGSGTKYADRIEDGEQVVGMDFFWDMIEQDKIDEEALIDMLKAAIEIHSGFPTEQESGSSSLRKTSGPRSTASSRRAASTRSS